MSYKYRSRRSSRRLAQKSRRNFVVSLIIIGLLIYATIQWILPTLISGIGFVNKFVRPVDKNVTSVSDNTSLAPPILNIPFEATNTAQISFKGYATPNSKVAIFIDDEKKDTVSVSENGEFELNNISLVLGSNNISGKTIDENSKESLSSKVIRVIYDNENPILEVSEPEDGKGIQGERKIKISGKTEAGIQLLIDDGQIVVNSEGGFETFRSLNDGENVFTIKALDKALNETVITRRVVFTP